MKGKIILITGGTSGIGKETVRGLAKLGATVVFTARDAVRGEEIKKEIAAETKNAKIDYLVCDLASFSSIKNCASDFKNRYKKLNVLINNAGALEHERKESKDGIEMDLAVNFLAPFLLTGLLLPVLKESAPARIINVSSTMHAEGEINFDDLESKNNFNRYKAYAQSKLALMLFTKKLSKELKNTEITVNSLHPGVAVTEMTMKNVRKMNYLIAFAFKRTIITPKEGAETSIYLASSPEVRGVTGEYFVKKKIAESSPQSHDPETTEKLWGIACRYTGAKW